MELTVNFSRLPTTDPPGSEWQQTVGWLSLYQAVRNAASRVGLTAFEWQSAGWATLTSAMTAETTWLQVSASDQRRRRGSAEPGLPACWTVWTSDRLSAVSAEESTCWRAESGKQTEMPNWRQSSVVWRPRWDEGGRRASAPPAGLQHQITAVLYVP